MGPGHQGGRHLRGLITGLDFKYRPLLERLARGLVVSASHFVRCDLLTHVDRQPQYQKTQWMAWRATTVLRH